MIKLQAGYRLVRSQIVPTVTVLSAGLVQYIILGANSIATAIHARFIDRRADSFQITRIWLLGPP